VKPFRLSGAARHSLGQLQLYIVPERSPEGRERLVPRLVQFASIVERLSVNTDDETAQKTQNTDVVAIILGIKERIANLVFQRADLSVLILCLPNTK
jgi:hypothetical protein